MEKLILFLKAKFPNGIQMFNTRNVLGDHTTRIYDKNGITVDYCPDWGYIEIFGLSGTQFRRVVEETSGY